MKTSRSSRRARRPAPRPRFGIFAAAPLVGPLAPVCPRCIAEQWAGCPNLIKPKHDPAVLPSGDPKFRSVVTEEVVQRKAEFLEYTATSGDWYFSHQHKKCVFCPDPLGVVPGSGVPANLPWATFAMDGLVVADATQGAHLYTAEQVRFRNDVRKRLFEPLPRCDEAGCHNLVVPGEKKCALHHPNPLGT
jgi:hypothetical protein